MNILATGRSGNVALTCAQDALVYNLGNGASYSVREVIDVAREATGRLIPAKSAARRPGDAARLVASPQRIRHELGWNPATHALRGIVASAWEWHRAHARGYDDR